MGILLSIQIIKSWNDRQNGHDTQGPHGDLFTDELLLASASKDGTVRFWNMDTVMLVGLIDLTDGGANPVWDVDFSADGTMVATAGEDGLVRLWGIPAPMSRVGK